MRTSTSKIIENHRNNMKSARFLRKESCTSSQDGPRAISSHDSGPPQLLPPCVTTSIPSSTRVAELESGCEHSAGGSVFHSASPQKVSRVGRSCGTNGEAPDELQDAIHRELSGLGVDERPSAVAFRRRRLAGALGSGPERAPRQLPPPAESFGASAARTSVRSEECQASGPRCLRGDGRLLARGSGWGMGPARLSGLTVA